MYLGSRVAGMRFGTSNPIPTVLLYLAISSILCTQSAVAAPNGRLVVATPQRGEFYFHGVLVPPPYAIAVGYNIQLGDTVWHGLYINNISLHPEPIPLSAEGRVDSVRREAMKLAIRTSGIPSGTPPAKTAQMLAAAFARIPGLVDSARAVSETALVIYWTGNPAPDWRPLSGKPFQQPEPQSLSIIPVIQTRRKKYFQKSRQRVAMG